MKHRENTLFCGQKMKWKTVILFAVITGIYTGLINTVAPLYNTSFRDIAISYEWWVVFAVIIVTAAKKNWEAMLKCFVFFLISQPLVYLAEWVIGRLFGGLSFIEAKDFSQLLHYYLKIWLPATFLTLPGGFIAYYCKRQNLLGSVILGIGNAIMLLMAENYIITAVSDFPYHILTAVFCIVAPVIMTLEIQKKRKWRIVSAAVGVGIVVILTVVAKSMGLYIVSNVF